jgi:PAS domain S-box-containing protein
MVAAVQSDEHAVPPAACTVLRTEAALRLGLSLTGCGIVVIDYVADTASLDGTAAAMFSLPVLATVSRADLHARFHPESATKVAQWLADATNPLGNGFIAFEHRIIGAGGDAIWVSARKQVEFSGSGDTKRAIRALVAVRDITARKAIDDGLRISEIRYRRLFEAADDGVLLVDPATSKIVDANPYMTRLLGYSHEQLVGKELFEIGLLKDRTMSQDMVKKLKENHNVRYEDLPLESDTGRHREVEVVANLYDENGRSIIQCNIRDITNRKLVEATAFQNAQLFSTLIDQAPSGVYVIDAGFRLAQVNPLAAPSFASVYPLIGRDFSEVLDIVWGPVVGRDLETIFRHTLSTGERYVTSDFAAARADIGVTQAFEWEVQRIVLVDGTYGVVCYFNDVTDHKFAVDAGIEREAHVRSILNNTQALIGLMSIDGTLLEANDPALTAARLTRERVIGTKLWDMTWWAGDLAEVARLKDAVTRSASGEVMRFDMVLFRADGRRMDIDFMLAPVLDADGKVTLLVPSGLDITDRKQSMHQIQLLMGEVNHRAMNLLGVVQAVARQTARDGDPLTFVTRLTERIGSLAASQDLLVQNEWQGVEVADLVSAQLSHYKGLFGTNVMFAGPPARLTPAAAQGIGMALHELATNAGKYGALSNSVGRVQISWLVTTAKPENFEMRWIETGGPLVVQPTRKGFGQKVIGPMAEASVNGSAETEHPASGLTWTLISPVADTLERRRPEPSNAYDTY